jgi:hypothetical protein
MLTPLEIIDTAVKIGLGALITSAAAYFLARGQHYRDLDKLRITRRRELIEDIAVKVEHALACLNRKHIHFLVASSR